MLREREREGEKEKKQARTGNDASRLCLCVYWFCDRYGLTDGQTDRWNDKSSNGGSQIMFVSQ